MSVHYKFKSALEYDTVTFDGLHISVGELKAAIVHQKRIGKSNDFDLQVTNAQTKEVYVDDAALIPKNTSLLVARVPLAQQPKKSWESTSTVPTPRMDTSIGKGSADLVRMEGTESDKIMAMMSQSTSEYDPSNYVKIKGSNQHGEVPANYRCYKCQMPGHWIKNCPLGSSAEPIEIKRSTGIPRSFMVPVDGPSAPGAMMTPTGTFAVPVIDHEAYQAGESAETIGAPVAEPEVINKQEIPEDLVCSLCKDLLTDAVMIPCCGTSFCDECIRTALLESEDHECPDCRAKDNSPEELIPNRFLRNSVTNFRNATGYNPRPRVPVVSKVAEKKSVISKQSSPEHGNADNENGLPSISEDLSKRNKDADLYDDSDGSDDNITVKVPPAQPMVHHHHHHHHRHQGSYNGGHSKHSSYSNSNAPYHPSWQSDNPLYGPSNKRNVKSDNSQSQGSNFEERAGTPTVDEKEQLQLQPSFRNYRNQDYPNRPQENYHGPSHPPHNSFIGPPSYGGPPYPPYQQPLPPGIKPHPNINEPYIDDQLAAFHRMIKEKEEKARLRAKRSRSRSRSHSRTRSRTRSRYTRSRSRSGSRIRNRSFSRSRSRSRPPSGRSPTRRFEKYRSYSRSPILRRPPHRPREHRSNSFSISRSRSRSRSLSRRRSPGRRISPQRFRSPGRLSPTQDHARHGGPGYKGGTGSQERPGRSPPPQSQSRVPPRSSHFPQQMGPQQYPPSSGGPNQPPRYPPRNIGPNSNHPPPLMMTPVMRYPTPYEEMPLGAQPPPPGFEPLMGRDDDGPPGVSEREREHERTNAPFRDPNYRDQRPNFPPQQNYRDQQYRDNGPQEYRDGQSGYRDGNMREGHPPGFRDGAMQPYRDSQNQQQYREQHQNYRNGSGFRDNNAYNSRDNAFARDNSRKSYQHPRDNSGQHRDNYRNQHSSRDHHSKPEHNKEKHREHGDRSKEYNRRDHERSGHDKSKDDRNRDYDKSKENHDKEAHQSPERRRRSPSLKRDRGEERSRHGTRDSRGRSKEPEYRKDVRKDDKSRKVEDKKIKEKRKKKKEKDSDKKRKKEKKTKDEKPDSKSDEHKITEKDSPKDETSKNETEKEPKVVNDLYNDVLSEGVDKNIVENYGKVKSDDTKNESFESSDNKESFSDILELKANDLDFKDELISTTSSKDKSKSEVLASVPELSKWEVDDDQIFSSDKRDQDLSPSDKSGKVTSEVLKRAENAIFAKAINAIRPIEIKKISLDRAKLYSGETMEVTKDNKSVNNIQITIPTDAPEVRSVEVNENVTPSKHEKTPPPKLSVKDRLGGKIDEQPSRKRDERVLHSTIERIKSRSKTPQSRRYEKETHRRITVDSSNRGRRVIAESGDSHHGSHRNEDKRHSDRHDSHSSHYDRRERDEGVKKQQISSISIVKIDIGKKKQESESPDRRAKKRDKRHRKEKDDKVKKAKLDKDEPTTKSDQPSKPETVGSKPLEKEIKKSNLDEASFEPDYDETLESDMELKEHNEATNGNASKQQPSTDKPSVAELVAANTKKRTHSESSSSSSDSSSSSSSSTSAKKRKRKKKKTKKKKAKHASSESGSDSGDSSDEPKKKKRKHKHKKKSSKKKKKSKQK